MSSSKPNATKPSLVDSLNLSPRDIEVAVMAYFCMTDEVKINYEKLEKYCGFKSTAVARNQWNLTKKKLNNALEPAKAAAAARLAAVKGSSDGQADSPATPGAGNDGNETATPGPSTKRKRGPAPKKGTAKKDTASDDTDQEDVVKKEATEFATPVKKLARVSKKKAAAQQEQEDAGANEEGNVEEATLAAAAKKPRGRTPKKAASAASATTVKTEEGEEAANADANAGAAVGARPAKKPRGRAPKKAAGVAGPSMAAVDEEVKAEPVEGQDEDAEAEEDDAAEA
ncbi:unnamed protein product [Discula destructiva]